MELGLKETDGSSSEFGPRELSLLIIGKTGNGKSTVGNAILGKDRAFPVGRGMVSTSKEASSHEGEQFGCRLKVVDSPDVSNLDSCHQDFKHEINYWKQLSYPGPDAVLLAIRCDVRYTPEEFAIYHQLKRHWGDNSLSERLVIVFTFGDRLDRRIEDEVRESCDELAEVLKDAKGRYVVFRKQNSEVKELLDKVRKMAAYAPCRLMIIGKTGNGKSTLGNTLLERQTFAVKQGMATTTTQPKSVSKEHKGWFLKVVDTPDIKNWNWSSSMDQAKQEVEKWKQFLQPAPHAVILAVRCGDSYTKEDVKIHREIFELWQNDSIYDQMVVAFTFGERWSDDLIKNPNPELQMALLDAHERYVVFSSELSLELQKNRTKQLLQIVGQLGNQDDESHEVRLLIIGRTGSGKSTLGNILLGTEQFPVRQTTVEVATKKGQLGFSRIQRPYNMKVLDTPDIKHLQLSEADASKQVQFWNVLLEPGAQVILLAVRCDVQFTMEENDLYIRLKKHIGENEMKKRLIVAFTFGDHLPGQIRDELTKASPDLQNVLKDAGSRYFVFSERDSQRAKNLKVKQFLEDMEDIICSQGGWRSSISSAKNAVVSGLSSLKRKLFT